ncbi:MAG: hypothetical protein Ta2E_12920 [Mycoplasmoidaceae bacterium]|nr:MAG: hypothetical protein Ta2E_12920 [Mycoplasmoidaceae bacterium]
MVLGFFKKLIHKAKTFVTKYYLHQLFKGLEAAGKVTNTVARVVNKVACVLQVTPLGIIANQIEGGLNMASNVVQKGLEFMQNLQPMIGNDGGGEYLGSGNKLPNQQ